MSSRPAAPWSLRCEWCEWYIRVGARGMRGRNPGAGVEAADLMREHVAREHGKTWSDYIGRRELEAAGELEEASS